MDAKIAVIGKMSDKFPMSPEIRQKLKDLRERKLMETVSYTEKQLIIDFVYKFGLYDLIYEHLNHEICKAAGRPQYSEANQDLNDFIYRIKEQFEENLNELQLVLGKNPDALNEPLTKAQFKFFVPYAFVALRTVGDSIRSTSFNAHQHQALMLCFQSLLNHA